jgi:hypothetical protein
LVKNESARLSLSLFGEIIKEAERIGACYNTLYVFSD